MPQESRRHVAKMALAGSQANILDWIPWRKPSFLIPRFLSPPPESSNNFQSATSRGHMPKFPRPAGIGAGWGDFDLFLQWQIHGRQVKGEMVENKEWSKLPEKTFQYVPARDSPAGTPGMTFTIDDAVLEETKRDEKLPKTLFEMVPRKER